MRRLNHPHIVEYYETIRTEGYLNIVLEYVTLINIYKWMVFSQQCMNPLLFMSRKGEIFMSVIYVCTHFAKFIRMYNFFQWYLRLFCPYLHPKKYLSILKKVYFNHDLTWFILSVFLTVILLYHFYFILLYFTLLYFTLLYFTLLYFTLLYFTLLYFTLLYFTLL